MIFRIWQCEVRNISAEKIPNKLNPDEKNRRDLFLKSNWDQCIRISMIEEARSLNLSNAVAVVSYEILRQHDFPNLAVRGLKYIG